MSSHPTKQLKLIIVGLDVYADIPSYFRELFGTPDQIKDAITADENRIRAAEIDITTFQIKTHDVGAGLQWIESNLCAQQYDGIMIGSGLRLIPTQTAPFESVVDVCRRVRPQALFMFNNGPGTNWDTLQRNMGKLG